MTDQTRVEVERTSKAQSPVPQGDLMRSLRQWMNRLFDSVSLLPTPFPNRRRWI